MALYTLRTGATAHPEDSVLQHLTDQINSSGVFDFAGNDFKVQAQGTPDLTIKVIKGRAYIKAVSGNSYPIRADADSNVSIGSNSSGNPRIDALVLFIDLSAAPNSDASNVAKLQVVQGTPAPSPIAPTDAAIQTEIGASNPFIRLANISVASGATSILNANITDTRVVVGFKVGKVELTEGRVSLLEQSTPGIPVSGKMLIYPKSDNKLYKLDDAGVETEVGAGGAGFMPNILENGNFHNVSAGGYGSSNAEDWNNTSANPIQGGYPELTKQQLIDILGITDGDVEGLWNLNGNFTDLSSNGYNLTAVNAPTDYSSSLMALAKHFTASSSQYATNTTVPNLRMAGSQTWFCLFRTNGLSTQRILGVSDSTPTNFVSIDIFPNGRMEFNMNGLSGTPFQTRIRVEANAWNLIVCSYNAPSNYVAVFINGLQTEFGTSGSHPAGSGGFSIGRRGDYNADFFNGAVQSAGVLSVPVDNNQMKRLWEHFTHSKNKIRRSGTDGYISQSLSMVDVVKYRGKTLTLGAEFYQDTASIESISIVDSSGSNTSTPVATTGSWLEDSVSRVISPTATFINVRLKVSTTNGNVWYRKVRLTESSAIIPYSLSESDWARLGQLINGYPPRDGQGAYHYELNRDYPFTVSPADVSWSNPSTTYTSLSDYGSSYRFISRNQIQWKPRVLFQGFNSALSYLLFIDNWVGGNLVESGIPAPGVVHFYGTPGPGPGSYHLGMATIGDYRHEIQKYDGGNITANGGFFYAGANWIYTISNL